MAVGPLQAAGPNSPPQKKAMRVSVRDAKPKKPNVVVVVGKAK